MATLHVRNVPDDLYERIQRRAAAQNRSVSAEVVTLLRQAVLRHPDAEAALFERMRRRRQLLQEQHGLFPSSVDDIRADRER